MVKSTMDGKGDPGYALTAGEFRAFSPPFICIHARGGRQWNNNKSTYEITNDYNTVVMVSECALGLLSPREKLPAIARRGGVLTPMVALGTILVKRLSASGRFEFESEVVGGDN